MSAASNMITIGTTIMTGISAGATEEAADINSGIKVAGLKPATALRM